MGNINAGKGRKLTMLDIQVFHKMVFTGGEDQKKYFIFTCLINELNRQELYIQEIDRQLARQLAKLNERKVEKINWFHVLVGLAVIGLIVIGVLVWGIMV